MLERASVSAECTAHLFLRRLELPTRSRRTLGLSFWRSAGDRINVPAWWPEYLNKVRANDLGNSVSREATGPSTLQTSAYRPKTQNASKALSRNRHTVSRSTSNKSRTFTQSVVKTQDASPVVADDPSQQEEDEYRHSENKLQQKAGNSQRGSGVFEPFHVPSDDANVILQERSDPAIPVGVAKPDYTRAWRLFIQSGQKKELAAGLLHFLAGSDERIDLGHALTAFDYIDWTRRSQHDFTVALRVALDIKRYKTAISIVRSAIHNRVGEKAYFTFMAYCVKNTLWNTLAMLWEAVGSDGRAKLRVSSTAGHRAKSPNIAGQYSFQFDDIPDFPGKVVTLAERLKVFDPVLAVHQKSLVHICKALAYVAVESPKVLGNITAKGLLSLFHVQQLLYFDSKLHLAALATIGRMDVKGTKSQLAMLIYRNYRFVYPESVAPRWVYGTLIGICAADHQPEHVYRLLLKEYKAAYDRPDEGTYRAVLHALAAQGEAKAAISLFSEFWTAYRSCDIRDLNSLVHANAVVGNVPGAQSQFNQIRARFNQTPDVVSWTSLVLAHARSPNSASAYEVFKRMRQDGVKPNSYTWSIMMSVAARRGDVETAQSLYNEARKENVPGDLYMVGALVEAFVLNDQLEQAEAVVSKASKFKSSDSPIRLWNTLLRHYAFKGDSKSLLRLQMLMKENEVEPDEMTYAALMTALVVQGRTKDAVKILRTLHYSRGLSVTEFHYTILVHGFALEKNRDMATIIYHEMLERFPRATPGAKLAMLHLHIARGDDAAQRRHEEREPPNQNQPQGVAQPVPWTALDYLADTLIQRSPSDLTSRLPNPGFGRRNPRDGLSSIYLHSLVRFLQSRAAYDDSQRLLETSQALVSRQIGPAVSIDTLTLEMNIAISEKRWNKTRELWTQIVQIALSSHGPVLDGQPTKPSTTPVAESTEPIGISTPSGDLNKFTTMIPSSSENLVDNTGNDVKVLPAGQFILSRPLSSFMQALDSQNQHTEIILLVRDLQKKGFALSSKNWNRFVQVLSKSDNPEHRLLAFQSFETFLYPNAPPWRLLVRGKWTSSAFDRLHDDIAGSKLNSRSASEQRDPQIARPSYFTMIHLASALLKVHRSAEKGKRSELVALGRHAPGTLSMVQGTPYLKDRIQGLLLRGRSLRGDPQARDRAAKLPSDVSGVKGSKSPLDNLPVEVLELIESEITPRDNIRELLKSREFGQQDQVEATTVLHDTQQERYLRVAEHIFGKVNREPAYLASSKRYETHDELQRRIASESETKLNAMVKIGENVSGEVNRNRLFLAAQGREESRIEQEDRIKQQESEKLELVAQIRQDKHHNTLTSDPYRGDPALDPLSKQLKIREVSTTALTRQLAEVLLTKDTEAISYRLNAIRYAIGPQRKRTSINELDGEPDQLDGISKQLKSGPKHLEDEVRWLKFKQVGIWRKLQYTKFKVKRLKGKVTQLGGRPEQLLGEPKHVKRILKIPRINGKARPWLNMVHLEASARSRLQHGRRRKPVIRLPRVLWAPDSENGLVDTKVLARPIDPNQERIQAAKAAFTIKKAKRREDLKERQSLAQWKTRSRTRPRSDKPTDQSVGGITKDAKKVVSQDSNRIARLASSRATRRFK